MRTKMKTWKEHFLPNRIKGETINMVYMDEPGWISDRSIVDMRRFVEEMVRYSPHQQGSGRFIITSFCGIPIIETFK